MLTFNANALADLERLYAAPQIRAQRERLRRAIGAKPGEIGLDIGCGVAYLSCELAPEVAPEGRIMAIDSSRDAVAMSRARVSQAQLDSLVDVAQGDALQLDFPSQSFDFVVASQVYSYIPDVVAALAEAVRVLKGKGRLIILDTDWEMCIWEARDRALSQRIVASRGAVQFAHGNLPRELPRHLRSAGLTLEEVSAFSIVETRYDPEAFGPGLIKAMSKTALKQGIAPARVAAWEEDLRARTGEGEWFFCLNRFIFKASK